MDNFNGGSTLRYSTPGENRSRRDEFLVPFFTAIIVLALGMVLVTITCRANPAQDSTHEAPVAHVSESAATN